MKGADVPGGAPPPLAASRLCPSTEVRLAPAVPMVYPAEPGEHAGLNDEESVTRTAPACDIHPCMHSALHAFILACIQPCMHSALHAFSLACIHPCMHSALHAFSLACIQPAMPLHFCTFMPWLTETAKLISILFSQLRAKASHNFASLRVA